MNKKDRVEQIVDELYGTRADIRHVMTEDELADPDMCARVDAEIVECSACAAWVTPDEVDEDGLCGGCQSDD